MAKTRVQIYLVLAIIVLVVGGLSNLAAADAAGSSFSIYTTTNLTGPFRAPITAHVGSIRIDQIPETLDEFKTEDGRSLLPENPETLDVIIIVPKGAPQSSRNELKTRIQEQLRSRYANTRFEIKESFVDLVEDEATLIEQRSVVEELRKQTEPGSREEHLANLAIAETEKGLTEIKNLRGAWWNPSTYVRRTFDRLGKTHPYATEPANLVFGMFKFTVGFVFVASRYVDPSGPIWKNAAALGLGVLAGGVSYLFGYNAKAWRNFTTGHMLPFRNFAADWYNRNRIVKSATINFFRSVVITVALRTLAAATGQTVPKMRGDDSERVPVGYPIDKEFWYTQTIVALPEVALDGFVETAIRALEEKGTVNHQGANYLFQAVALIDTTMHAFLRGNLNLGASIMSGVSIVSKLTIFTVARFSPERNPRMIFVSDAIRKTPTASYGVVRGKGFLVFLYSQFSTALRGFKGIPRQEMPKADFGLVVDDNALTYAWNLDPSESDLNRIANDPNLTIADLRDILSLSDFDSRIVNKLWVARNAQLGQPLNLRKLCTEALSITANKK